MKEDRTHLNKHLKVHWVWAIAVGSSIGWGAFIQPVSWLEMAGPLGVAIGFSIGALLMIIIAVSYGMLIQEFPVSGGEFAYAYIGLGRTHAFICGWFLTLGYICIVALNASALSLMIKYISPSTINQFYLYSIAGWDIYGTEVFIGIAILLVFSYFNIKGTLLSGRLQFVFCLIMVLSITLVAFLMTGSTNSNVSNLFPLFNSSQAQFAGVLSIIAIAPWAFVGFDNVPQVAEEFNFSSKKAFKLIVFGIIAAALLYILMVYSTAIGKPWQDTVAIGGNWGTADVIASSIGSFGLVLLQIALLMGILTGLNGFIMSASRLLFAMSRAKALPVKFSRLHNRFGTPHFSIIFTVIIAMTAPWFGRAALLWVVDMSSIGVSIAYFYTCYTAYKLLSDKLKKEKEEEIFKKIRIKKTIALVGSILSLTFIGLLVLPISPAYLSIESRTMLLIWIILGVIFYLIRRKKYQEVSEEEMNYLITGKNDRK